LEIAVRRINRSQLITELPATRARLLRLIDCLTPKQWEVPRLPTINPPLWELGHVGWFQENWCVRYRRDGSRANSVLAQSDQLYDSSAIANPLRWDLLGPQIASTKQYLSDVLELTLEKLALADDTDDGLYFFRLALFHEKMHTEAFAYTWQALGYAAAELFNAPKLVNQAATDLTFNGGPYQLGSVPNQGFIFDNEKTAHPIELKPFSIAGNPVSNAQYLAFVQDDGYARKEFWDPSFFSVLESSAQRQPKCWYLKEDQFYTNWFGVEQLVDSAQPVMHVSAYEAQAYCAWAKRRLPSEAEWEFAAAHDARFHWGQSVWEWTSCVFAPFAGFSADAYADYSVPWFGNHRVVRGGSFATPTGVAHLKLRNFYRPHRDDFFVGFRTCAV
jgi:gamma-glutamyl hercynylcysteine S-oxide synthase